ncbi:MAG: hypothetical protein JWP23_1701 [Phenylobacterium sp.]|nr:hypothetical protein [Phenylobacterium sp.]
MFDTEAIPETAPTDPVADRAERHGRVLQELTDLGMNLARAVSAQAADADRATAHALALDFARIARAVRQTVALEAKLADDRQTSLAERAQHRQREADAQARRRRTRIESLVERAIDAEASGSEADNLYEDLRERLEDADDLAGFHDRPIPEIVALICKDLGLTPPLVLWDDADWGIESEAAALPEAVEGAGGRPISEPFEGPLPDP